MIAWFRTISIYLIFSTINFNVFNFVYYNWDLYINLSSIVLSVCLLGVEKYELLAKQAGNDDPFFLKSYSRGAVSTFLFIKVTGCLSVSSLYEGSR